MRNGARVWQASLQADLRAEPSVDKRTGNREFVVSNFGRGVARKVEYLFLEGDQRVDGRVWRGYLRPEVTWSADTRFEPTDQEIRGVLVWRDYDGATWAWSMATDTKTRLKRPPRGSGPGSAPSADDAFRKLYSDEAHRART